MEQLVARKLEEMNTRTLAWDPDEYTVAFREQLERQREKENQAKANVDEADEADEARPTSTDFN